MNKGYPNTLKKRAIFDYKENDKPRPSRAGRKSDHNYIRVRTIEDIF